MSLNRLPAMDSNIPAAILNKTNIARPSIANTIDTKETLALQIAKAITTTSKFNDRSIVFFAIMRIRYKLKDTKGMFWYSPGLEKTLEHSIIFVIRYCQRTKLTEKYGIYSVELILKRWPKTKPTPKTVTPTVTGCQSIPNAVTPNDEEISALPNIQYFLRQDISLRVDMNVALFTLKPIFE